MEMQKKINGHRSAHCLVLPYPAQGHINPMIQFSKRLQHRGVRVTLAITNFISKTSNIVPSHSSHSVAVETISDGYDNGRNSATDNTEAYLKRFREVGSQTLANLLQKLRASNCPVDCVIYDAFLPWVLDVAKDQFGLVGAAFFTQSCAVGNIYYHVQRGHVKLPLPCANSGRKITFPGLPPLESSETPTFISNPESYPVLFDMLVNQFSNVDKADWVLCNTFYELEQEVVDWMAKLWPLKTIGPTIPSIYLDEQIQDDNDYGLNLFKPKGDICKQWLKDKPKKSVIYVSFGSLAALNEEQMEELAWGLKLSDAHFLWVVRSTEEAKLPHNFTAETTGKGLVVSWCKQLEVLANEAIGCFITHCGWNSTLEALSLGVPLIAMPQWSDQSTNAKCIMDVWEMGLKAQPNGKGIVKREEIGRCIGELMEGERGKEIKRNAVKWRNLAREAVDEGGSSDRNINEFVAGLTPP